MAFDPVDLNRIGSDDGNGSDQVEVQRQTPVPEKLKFLVCFLHRKNSFKKLSKFLNINNFEILKQVFKSFLIQASLYYCIENVNKFFNIFCIVFFSKKKKIKHQTVTNISYVLINGGFKLI